MVSGRRCLLSCVLGAGSTDAFSELAALAVIHVAMCSVVGGGKAPPPKDVHVLVPGTCEYAALCGRRLLGDVDTLSILRWGEYPGLSNHEGLCKRKAESQSDWKMVHYSLGERGRSHGPRSAGNPSKLEKPQGPLLWNLRRN